MTARPNSTAATITRCSICCLKEFDWAEKSKLSGKLIDGYYHGLAVGSFIEGGAAGPKEDARLVLETDGSLSVYLGSSSVGQGLETIMAQIAADAIELPLREDHASSMARPAT